MAHDSASFSLHLAAGVFSAAFASNAWCVFYVQVCCKAKMAHCRSKAPTSTCSWRDGAGMVGT